MDKKIIPILTVLFMLFVGFQFAEPAAAVKVVDHGVSYKWDKTQGMWRQNTWTTYQYNNNFMKTVVITRWKFDSKYTYGYKNTITLAKVSKDTIKIRDVQDIMDPYVYSLNYKKTKLTAAQYYWRVYRTKLFNWYE